MKLTENNSKYYCKGLDVLFVALNPPKQSNRNGHYFSGKSSLFFSTLYQAGLITSNLDKTNADEFIFGSNQYNYNNKKYGVVDTLPYLEETQSKNIKISDDEYYSLLDKLIYSNSKNIVLMHGKISKKFESMEQIKINYGNNEMIFDYLGIKANIFKVPFPNGSSYKKEQIIEWYSLIKEVLWWLHIVNLESYSWLTVKRRFEYYRKKK